MKFEVLEMIVAELEKLVAIGEEEVEMVAEGG